MIIKEKIEDEKTYEDILEEKIGKLKYRTEIEQEEELRKYLKEIDRENLDTKKSLHVQ